MATAKLHFKDGRIQEEHFPDGETPVRFPLPDENGNVTHLFKLREELNENSSVVDYDEIDLIQTMESKQVGEESDSVWE